MYIGASHKVTMTLDYRRRWQNFLNPDRSKKPGLWIHGASVGELEDLAAFYCNSSLMKEAGYDFSELILTSSSPSAEEFLVKIKNKINPRYAGPLPPDVTPRVKEFFNTLNPELLILSQSDLWPVLMSLARKKLSRGAIWLPHKNDSASWGKKVFLKDLVKKVALRREDSHNPLPNTPSEFIGSPRIDRILERIEEAKNKAHPLGSEFDSPSQQLRIIIGSAWKEDALCLRDAIQHLSNDEKKKLEIRIIPHEVKNSTEATAISSLFPKGLVSKEGILLEAYRNFDIALVGGGFRTGLHNVIEPLVWGIPVVCGKDLSKQPEAKYFANFGALQPIKEPKELTKVIKGFLEKKSIKNVLTQKALEASELLKVQAGASIRLSKLIKKTH